MDQQVTDIMSARIVTVDMDDTLAVVREIFENLRFHHLLVVEDRRLVGIISDRDLLKAVSPNIGRASETNRDLATLSKRAHQVMSRRPVTIAPDARTVDAISLFNASGMSCLPVVDDDGRPVGVLTWRDVMRALEPRGSDDA